MRPNKHPIIYGQHNKTGPFGSSLHARDYVRNGIPIINPMHLLNGIIVPSVDMSVDDGTAHRLSAYQLGENDVVIGCRGEIGRVALVTSHESGWLCGTGCFFVHFKPTIHAPYVALYLRTPRCVERLVGEAVGTTLINLNQSILAKTLVALPPLSEQRRISAALSDVDEWIASLDKLIEKKKLVKQGTMQALLTGKTRLPGFEGEWQTESFGNAFEFLSHNTLSRASLGETGTIANVHYGDILVRYGSLLDFAEETPPFVSKELEKSPCGDWLKDGDLILADTAEDETVGKAVEIVNLKDRLAVAGLHTFACRPRQPFAPGWLGYFANSSAFHDQLLPFISGTKVCSISKDGLKLVTIHRPSLPEQRAIATVLSDMDAEIAALSREKTKAEQLKQGMMQDLLTGRVRLAEGE